MTPDSYEHFIEQYITVGCTKPRMNDQLSIVIYDHFFMIALS